VIAQAVTGASPSGLARWIRAHLIECALFALGVMLRLTMLWSYSPTLGYDAPKHWQYVQWLMQRGELPPLGAIVEAFHPPLFYASVAQLARLGVGLDGMTWFPVSCGILRLGTIWCGLAWYLPDQPETGTCNTQPVSGRRHGRWARAAALALAAVFPSSVHLDGMLYAEPLNGLLAAAAMVLIPRVFQAAAGRSRWLLAIAVGVVLGLEMLSKVSGLALLLAIALAVFCQLACWPADRKTALAQALPWSAALAVCLAISGWFYLRNLILVGNPFPSSFDLSERAVVEEFAGVPYFHRRTLGFFLGWNLDIYAWPYWPAGLKPHARFFPTALASSFVDYWNYSFSGLHPAFSSGVWANHRPLTERVLAYSRLSVLGGTAVFAATLGAGAAALRRTFKTRDWGRLCLLLIPIVVVLFAVHFATKYPRDEYGVIKGAYLQFGAPPLYALFGLAVAWSGERRWRWPLLLVLLLGLWMVAAYTLYCRTRVAIFPTF
jgi:hypothetical protein